jgi:ribonucleotide reductase beta subunit family protein with ferritin-like domain
MDAKNWALNLTISPLGLNGILALAHSFLFFSSFTIFYYMRISLKMKYSNLKDFKKINRHEI